MKALLINDRSVEKIEIENTLEALQKAVDGYIETLTLIGGYAVMIVNEEGLLRGMPSNLTASAVAARKIVGPVLVVGVDGEEFTDIPKDVEHRIVARWG
jgi:formylmethanofuran dehydrogenase subunit B